MTKINQKKTYDKPTMVVYLLKTKPELLQSSAPIYDEDTDQQW